MRGLPVPWGQRLTAEEADRNARELVAEEERVKRKAEKKKLKKKKQKDRKKREKLGQEPQSQREAEPSSSLPSSTAGPGCPQSSNAEEGEASPGHSPSLCPGDSAESSGEERGGRGAWAEQMEDELDLSCTFVCKARQKAGVRLPVPGKEKPPRKEDAEPGKRAPGKAAEPTPVPPDAGVVQQSLVLAARGTEAAQQGRFAEAVAAFSEAVRLNPREHRLFGNRSYCYEKLQRYEEALGDATAALQLQPGWPKGLFRKGKALRGLQRYAEAASAFEELLRRDGANAEAAAQLSLCRALLPQNGPHGWSSLEGIPASPPMLEAGEPPPLPPSGERVSRSCRDKDTSGLGSCRSQGWAAAPQTLPPTHPARDCYPLWVGNVTARISQKVLQGSFSRFGEIRSLRLLPERRCAFINYAHKAAAEAAYAAMQDAELEGIRLVLQLKHPSHATPAPPRHAEPCGKVGAPPRGPL
ncbi:tetratricopeptide repeat protein 31-like [Patagioenas fasciata monilis]|uniref:Tetratricopeptide repeat protein 31-like n=2 Tax=Patagioenas fasciata TaxID=372321 RepID=A0A1V4J9F7_PATFA|nr:tetratricopeptide repeat protein 31-like [Patagioenas fasciata monilis]